MKGFTRERLAGRMNMTPRDISVMEDQALLEKGILHDLAKTLELPVEAFTNWGMHSPYKSPDLPNIKRWVEIMEHNLKEYEQLLEAVSGKLQRLHSIFIHDRLLTVA